MQSAEQRKQVRTARKAAGLCVHCGKVAAMPACNNCTACAEKLRAGHTISGQKARAKRRAAGLCPKCGKPPAKGKKLCAACVRKSCAENKELQQRVRLEVLEHYGNKCACCGEPELEFLQMDHIAGGGYRHRRQDPAACRLYRWLKNHGYPPGFQILCCNCNNAKWRLGLCPHQRKRDARAS
jgi:hypothetical protein